jgi:HEAT repeat protein
MFRRRLCLTLIAAVVLAAAPALVLAQQPMPAEGDEAQLIATLQRADATVFEKAKACQTLAVIGTRKCVPVLAGMLGDEKMAHYARFGLQPIPDPAVDEALRDALGKLQGMLLVGVIDSIGIRRDAKAVEPLEKLLGDSDLDVARAAAAALGRIATPEAVGTLKQALGGPAGLRPAVGDACLTACDMLLADGNRDDAAALYDAVFEADVPRHVQIAAAQGAIRARGAAGLPKLIEYLASDDKDLFQVALGAARQIPAEGVTQVLVAQLDKAKPAAESPAKVLVIKKAEYGAQDKWVDVTDQLNAAMANNALAVTAGNQLAGDPINGVVKQLRVTYSLGGDERTVEVPENETLELRGDALPEHPRQVLIVYALGDLGDKAALPAVLEAAQSGAWDIRLAAVRALAKLGDATAVPALLKTAVEGEGGLAAAARDSLVDLKGQEVDAAIVAAFDRSEGNARVVLIDLIGQRGIGSAVPALLKTADSDDDAIRRAAISSLGVTVGLDNLDALLARLLEPKSPGDLDAIRESLKTACLRMPDRDATAEKLLGRMSGASAEAKEALLELTGTVGGQKALAGVAAAARAADPQVQDAATRVLGEWMSADAAPVLLDLARTLGDNRLKVRALRGYIRIARQLDVAPEERLAMCRTAMEAAQRDDEKKLVLEVLGRIPSAASLAMVAPNLDNAGLKDAAAAAAVTIAAKIVDQEPAAVAEAMKKAVGSADEEVAKRAKGLLGRANRKLRSQ